MKLKTLLTALIVLTALNISEAEAGAYQNWMNYGKTNDNMVVNPSEFKDNMLIKLPEFPELQMSCFGCISPNTGRPRTNYVRPHFNNGRFVGGYYRS